MSPSQVVCGTYRSRESARMPHPMAWLGFRVSRSIRQVEDIYKISDVSLSQKSELVMGMSLGVPSKRHQLGRC